MVAPSEMLLVPVLTCLPDADISDRPRASRPKVMAAAPGRIEGSSDMISIGASINGTVERVEAHQGDRVTSGQTLIRIVCNDLKARLALKLAEREAQRPYYRKLVNGARKEEREIAAYELTLSEARLAEAQAGSAAAPALTQTSSVSLSVRDVDDRDAHMAAAQREVARNRVALLPGGHARGRAGRSKGQRCSGRSRRRRSKGRTGEMRCEVSRGRLVLRKNVSEGELISIYYPKPLMVVSEVQGYRVRAEVDEYDVPHIEGRPVRRRRRFSQEFRFDCGER